MVTRLYENDHTLAGSVSSTSGVYFVTAFSGLLAPYWDPGATGLLVSLTSYTTRAHIARATLEANAFQTRAVIERMKLDSNSELAHLKANGGMTNGDVTMGVLADVGWFRVVRPKVQESTALGSALLVGATIGLFGWDIARLRPETFVHVNTTRALHLVYRNDLKHIHRDLVSLLLLCIHAPPIYPYSILRYSSRMMYPSFKKEVPSPRRVGALPGLSTKLPDERPSLPWPIRTYSNFTSRSSPMDPRA